MKTSGMTAVLIVAVLSLGVVDGAEAAGKWPRKLKGTLVVTRRVDGFNETGSYQNSTLTLTYNLELTAFIRTVVQASYLNSGSGYTVGGTYEAHDPIFGHLGCQYQTHAGYFGGGPIEPMAAAMNLTDRMNMRTMRLVPSRWVGFVDMPTEGISAVGTMVDTCLGTQSETSWNQTENLSLHGIRYRRFADRVVVVFDREVIDSTPGGYVHVWTYTGKLTGRLR